MAKTKGFHTSHHHPRKDATEELAFGLATPKAYFSTKSWLKGHTTPARHSRSKSAPDNDFDLENWDLSPSNFQQRQDVSPHGTYKKQHTLHVHRSALEQDVAELQKRLSNERAVRHALEKAMGRASSAISPGHRHLTPQTKELIREINCLEEEVVDLEQHVLSLYRRFFTRRFSRSSSLFNLRHKTDSHDESRSKQNRQVEQEHTKSSTTKANAKQKQNQAHQHRRNISAATQGNSAAKVASFIQTKSRHGSIIGETMSMASASQSSHSQNLLQSKALKDAIASSNSSFLNEDGPRPLRDYLSETPNRLSEELIRCMVTIYCRLSDPPLPQFGMPGSPSSVTSSSTSVSSAHGVFSDGWSPGCKPDFSYEIPLVDPYNVKGKNGKVGPYSCMVEVPWIFVDKERLSYASRLLHDFRSMVEQLEKVDPSQLNHNEKLAFWINIYNSLLMHAYLLAYGIPRNNLKRMNLLQRAACKVGGRSINAHAIEQCILGCRSHRPTQWLQNLLLPGSKLKSSDERRLYAIEHPEPLVCFALCCGGRSDPAIRVYTAKNVHEELECAKREFLQASIGFQNERKVLLPKILEWYIREASISSGNLLEWVSQYLEEKERECLQRCIKLKPHKSTSHCIEWVSYTFNFRYLFDPDLAMRFSNRVP